MTVQRRYTSADLDILPEIEGIRYEIIDGDLFVSKMPTWEHEHAEAPVDHPRFRQIENFGEITDLVAKI